MILVKVLGISLYFKPSLVYSIDGLSQALPIEPHCRQMSKYLKDPGVGIKCSLL